MNPNRKAFLDMIAVSEIGERLLSLSDNGYDVLVGGTLFTGGYADHPRKLVKINEKLYSTAAGRYQILERYYNHYKKQLDLPDFSPESQDAIALQLIRECKALEDIDEGRFYLALKKCASRWASLPGAGYGQHENSTKRLAAAYVQAGGTIA